MTSAAQIDTRHTTEEAAEPFALESPVAEPFALKEQVAARLAAHRARRGGARAAVALEVPQVAAAEAKPARSRTAEIADAVARRYADSPSYRAVLAEESERSLRQAEAAAEVANINARAIARAQQQLLVDLGEWQESAEPVSSISLKAALPAAQPAAAAAAIIAGQRAHREAAAADKPILLPEPPPARLPAAEVATPTFTVRLYEDAGRPVVPATPAITRVSHAPAVQAGDSEEQEALLLDEEIAFRHAPSFTEATAPEAIAANLIEFPRQLVAARKARPRLAEGPLREEEPAMDATQLRIFEVEAEHISVAPVAAEAEAPEWSSILLPSQPAMTFFDPVNTDYTPATAPQAAPLSRRVMSGVVDLCVLTFCVLAAAGVFIMTASGITHAPLTVPLQVAAAALVVAFVVLGIVYHLLFFTFSDATPGMRYARLALCTMTDENPARAAMRRRLLAMGLAALPLGLGYVWAMLDEDGLGWHDRMSRMYQRAY